MDSSHPDAVWFRIKSNENFTGVLVVHCEKESFMKPELWDATNPVSHCYARPSISEVASVNDKLMPAGMT